MNERRKKKMDILNQEEFIENVIQVVCQLSENKRGSCFAIEGNWGVGKTFVAEEIEKKLEEIAEERTIVLVVDELDRCVQQYAIKVNGEAAPYFR